jgi:hypothetical protein
MPTGRLEGVFGVDFGGGRDEFAAGRGGAEDTRFPRRAVLQHGFEEELLLVACEDLLDDAPRDGLRAASGRHFGLVGGRLGDHCCDAGLAVCVPAEEGL